MNSIQQSVLDALPGKRKQSSGGWISFNAVCCHHNGESTDKRGRGGVIMNGDAVSYHCFNCNFKTGWQPGRHISFKMRKLLTWLGVDENTRQMLNIEALRIKDTVQLDTPDEDAIVVEFNPKPLPEGVVPLNRAPDAIQQYAHNRCLPLDKLLWSNSKPAGMWKRIIVPFTWDGQVIGFSARSTDDAGRPKYFTSHDSGYCYGIDNQLSDARFCIVTEGLLDAVSINGVGVLSNQCSEQQAQIIDTLAREVILVPDKDTAGQKLIDDAITYGWSVSFPDWHSDIKDVNDAVVRYGQLFTIKSILDAKQTSSLKINLLRKKW